MTTMMIHDQNPPLSAAKGPTTTGADVFRAPGTPGGPCAEPCTHRDCRGLRSGAGATCAICACPIGYNTGFYYEGGPGGRGHLHADCLEHERRQEA